MYRKYISILGFITVMVIPLWILNPLQFDPDVQAQSSSLSLITPYFGSKNVTSYFDHGTPTGAHDTYFINYIGKRWNGNVDVLTCDEGDSEQNNNCYDGHNGLDFAMSYEHVLAAADGVVYSAGWTNNNYHSGDNGSYGLRVDIIHSINGHVYKTRYAHLATIAVEVGASVRSGQIIGTSGSTGVSTGPHLHFDVSICINTACSNPLLDFRAIDPFGWQPALGQPVQIDPWDNPNGAHSWCMWRDGEFVNKCNPARSSHPLPEPVYGNEIIIDDTIDNTSGFQKGYNGRWNHICIGIDPGCREWWQSSGQDIGWGNRTYRTITNGLAGDSNTPDNWAQWRPPLSSTGKYEVFVWVPEIAGYDNNTFTWQAHFQILDSQYVFRSTYVDEYIDGYGAYNPRKEWLSLGAYDLDPNSALFLMDDGEAPDTHCPLAPLVNGHHWCRVAADAVKFVQIMSKNYLPVANNAPTLTPTPTPTNTPTPTPTRTPTPAPPYNHCENNNTLATACYPGAASFYSYIYPSGDVDWFRFNVDFPTSQARLLMVRLLSIPSGVNYDLELYSGSGALLNSSHHTGNTDEYIGRHIEESGTYYLRVYPVSGNHQTDSYNITFDYSTIEQISYPPPEG